MKRVCRQTYLVPEMGQEKRVRGEDGRRLFCVKVKSRRRPPKVWMRPQIREDVVRRYAPHCFAYFKPISYQIRRFFKRTAHRVREWR